MIQYYCVSDVMCKCLLKLFSTSWCWEFFFTFVVRNFGSGEKCWKPFCSTYQSIAIKKMTSMNETTQVHPLYGTIYKKLQYYKRYCTLSKDYGLCYNYSKEIFRQFYVFDFNKRIKILHSNLKLLKACANNFSKSSFFMKPKSFHGYVNGYRE